MSVGAYPAHQVDFAPGVASSVTPSGGDWVEITSKVLSWGVKFGSEDEFTQPGAGTGELLLNNSAGLFDPDNTSGTYFGDLLPGMWFRIMAGGTTADRNIFYGQVSQDGFQVAASQYADSVVAVHLEDVAEFLANTDIETSVYVQEVTPDAPLLWWRLGEPSGTVAFDASGNNRHGTYTGCEPSSALIVDGNDGATGFDSADDQVQFPSHTLGSTWTIEFWLKSSAATDSTSIVWLADIGFINIGNAGSDTTKLTYEYIDPSTSAAAEYESTADVFDGAAHHIVVTQSGATTKLYVDGVEGKTLASGAASSVTWPAMLLTVGGLGSDVFNGVVDEFAVYNTALSAARVLAHYHAGADPWAGDSTSTRVGRILDLVGYDAAHRLINTGNTTMQAAKLNDSAWNILTVIARTEGGVVYVDHFNAGKVRFDNRHQRLEDPASVTSQVTIGDGGGAEVPAKSIGLVDDRIINKATMQRDGGTAVTVDESAGSVYRVRSRTETGLQYETDAESEHRAQRIVAEKKDRHRRVRQVVLEPRKLNHPAWLHVFDRQINARITVKWRPTYGGTYTFAAWIIGIAHRWDKATGLTTTWWCAPVPFDTTGSGTPYWLAGVSTTGVDNRAGY